MLKIKVLGSGSGISCKNRFQSSIALSDREQRFILLDCGEPAARQLECFGFALDHLEAVFISHLHADHVSGLFQLIQNMQIRRREKPLKIIMPQEGHFAFRKFLDAIYLSDKVILFVLELITPEDAKTIGAAECSFLRTRHLEGFAALSGNPGEANSCVLKYAVDGHSLRIVYSGDVQSAAEIVPLLQERTRLLIVEAAHFSPESLFENISAAPHIPEQILITHIGPRWPEHMNDIQASAIRNLSENTIIAYDGLELIL